MSRSMRHRKVTVLWESTPRGFAWRAYTGDDDLIASGCEWRLRDAKTAARRAIDALPLTHTPSGDPLH